MITQREFELYRSADFIAAVEENIDREPNDIAFDKHIPFARELATRVKYLQKAKAKLPSFYAARCIIPPRAFEQSTSEAVAAGKRYSGEVCLDLTCGLGVDTYALSKGFRKVVALERDPLLADVARYNFGLLGVDNVEVMNSSAEQYIAANPGLKLDMVYADPDRRNEDGKRVAALEDCSPDVRALLPRLKEIAQRVVIKLSPLFDIHEAFRIFGDGTQVIVISDGGECKEVLVETGSALSGQTIVARITGGDEILLPYRDILNPPTAETPAILQCGYMAVPDVALVKSGIAPFYYASQGWYMNSVRGFAFGCLPAPSFGSRVFPLMAIEPYNPKKLKTLLRDKGILKLNFFLRDFPYGTAQVARQLGIKEGGNRFAALTTVDRKQMFFLLGQPDAPAMR